MVDKKISQPIKELLHDPDFVMWCMMPTEELDNKWRQWEKLHPEMSSEFRQAQTILKFARLNEHKVPDDKSEELWTRLQQSVKRKERKRNMFFVRYAAASVVLLLLSVSVFLVLNRGGVENQKLASGTVQADTTHTELEIRKRFR